MRIIVDLNKDGTKLSTELMFTGPCARLEGNTAYRMLKQIQKAQNLQGMISESNCGYRPNKHWVYDEDVLSFTATDSETIRQVILEENRKRYPDANIYVETYENGDVVTVLVSENPIPADFVSDYVEEKLTIGESEVLIDTQLVDLIKKLNDKGYATTYCCSGHQSVSDGFIEIADGKGYSREKIQELFPDRKQGEKTIELRSLKPSISSGYIMFENTEKNADLFRRLEENCEFCKNGAAVFGILDDNSLALPQIDDREPFENHTCFYTEYPDYNGKKPLILRWCQRTNNDILDTVQKSLIALL